MKNDGGPAFPQNDATVNRINNHDGMSLRDYFAAKAMAATLVECLGTPEAKNTPHDAIKWVSVAAYKIADAMLAARGAQ